MPTEELPESGPPALKMFPHHRPARVPQIRAKADDPCQHLHPIIDERLRQVECGDCGALLDPIALLVEWALYDHRLDDRLMLAQHYESRQADRERLERERRIARPQRMRCQSCRKLFVPMPDPGTAGICSHWGTCEPCHTARLAAGPAASA